MPLLKVALNTYFAVPHTSSKTCSLPISQHIPGAKGGPHPGGPHAHPQGGPHCDMQISEVTTVKAQKTQKL